MLTVDQRQFEPNNRQNYYMKKALWLGPLFAIVGCITYFTVFSQFPVTRDTPWINLPLVGLGLFLSLVALMAGWKKGNTIKRVFLAFGAAVSLFFAGFLILYVYVITSQMPMPKSLSFVSNPNDISLPASGGRTLSMGDYPDKRLLVSFFRGYW